MAKKPYYLTTAIAYTSGKPHIGNVYEIVLADAIVRFRRNQGYDVRFQTGSDEHGQKVELKAGEMGVTPKEFVDTVSDELKRNWDLMNTKEPMRECTVLPANPFLHHPSLPMESARIAEGSASRQRRKHIF